MKDSFARQVHAGKTWVNQRESLVLPQRKVQHRTEAIREGLVDCEFSVPGPVRLGTVLAQGCGQVDGKTVRGIRRQVKRHFDHATGPWGHVYRQRGVGREAASSKSEISAEQAFPWIVDRNLNRVCFTGDPVIFRMKNKPRLGRPIFKHEGAPELRTGTL